MGIHIGHLCQISYPCNDWNTFLSRTHTHAQTFTFIPKDDNIISDFTLLHDLSFIRKNGLLINPPPFFPVDHFMYNSERKTFVVVVVVVVSFLHTWLI